ncbi:MAG: YbjN domain-containing protein [Deinococcales bacterium]
MTEVNAQTIERFFAKYQWSFETIADGVWRTGFKGENGFFTIYMRLTDAWLYMTISPFVPAPQLEKARIQTMEAMLNFNREMNLAKFVLDEDEDVTLTVELPLSALRYEVFSEGLTALAYYADDIYPDMLELAQDANAVSRFKNLSGKTSKPMVA